MSSLNGYSLVITCPDETKDVLIAELKGLGIVDVKPSYRAVQFETDERLYYLLHLCLRTSSKILRVITICSSKSEQMLYDQAQRIHWPEWFDATKSFRVDAIQTDRGPDKMSSNEISKNIRLGIESAFQKIHSKIPKVDLKEPEVEIVAFQQKDKCMISINTSGQALHKRGYRLEGHPAPIKETLAAALLKLIGYDGTKPFFDPMCGSGTIAIEAAYLALNKAPLIHRKKDQFGFEHLKDFNKNLWRTLQDEVRLKRLEKPTAEIYAADILQSYVDLAKNNALRARVEKHIGFMKQSFFDAPAPAQQGILLTNLPYGERLNNHDDMVLFYKNIGDTLKRQYAGWKVGLLVNKDSPYKFIGLHSHKKFSLLNGNIPVVLLIFEIYKGSKKHDSDSR